MENFFGIFFGLCASIAAGVFIWKWREEKKQAENNREAKEKYKKAQSVIARAKAEANMPLQQATEDVQRAKEEQEVPRKLKTYQWIWLPSTVLVIGAASIILLLLAERVHERQRIDADIADAIMDAQNHSTSAHLWLEHAISGDFGIDRHKIIADLDQAIHLLDITLNGGASEYGRRLNPIQDQKIRSMAQDTSNLLIQFKTESLKRLNNPEMYGIGSAFDQFYDTKFLEISDKIRTLERLIETEKAKNEEKSRLLFLAITIIWIIIVISAAAIIFFLERKRNEFKSKLIAANTQLHSRAIELSEHRERLAELVESRTAELKDTYERLRIEMKERLQTCEVLHDAEKQNRSLSDRLLYAQEIERKRIAMGLHDELGQSLNVIKLQLRVIEKGSMGGREECEELLDYIDQTIENVRRISMALSPTVLEDLGLTSALQWLIENLKKDPSMRMMADVADIDHLFSRKNWITIYRVAQEALSNVVKHAQAENVSFVTRMQSDRVAFSVEDDGNGFDLEQSMTQGADAKGLGLITMRERVEIMGGDFDLWTRKGIGTRVSFSLPVEYNEA